jgi:hypothetical protein
MSTRTGRPRRTTPARRFHLTLDEADASLLEAYAQEVGQQPMRVAGELVRRLLRGSTTNDGRIEKQQVDALLRAIRGEDREAAPNEPRWQWPIQAILADRRWWDRWLPDLNELMGRQLAPKTAELDYDEQGRRRNPAPVLDRRGYGDLMEFLFPTLSSSRGGGISWRSPEYPLAAAAQNGKQADPALPHLWESVIRHVVRALCALERSTQPLADPVMGILTQDHIAGPWLHTLRVLCGQDAPDALPQKRLG